MNPFLKLAALFVMAAGIGVGQNAPEASPAPSSASVNPPVSSATPPAQAPDLTFKPNPQDETPIAPPVVPQTPAPAKKPNAPESSPKPAAASSTAGPAKAKSAAGNKSTAPAAATPEKADMPLYVLGANDVVGVSVFDEPHVPGSYAIGPDGRMSVPLIGNFKAVGLTIPQLQAVITEKLSEFMIDPVVNVQLLRNNSKKYTIIGGVGRAGPYPLLQETTILDALAACGGFRDFSNQTKIILRRGTKEFKFNFKEVRSGKHLEQNITIEDGDIIIVPGD